MPVPGEEVDYKQITVSPTVNVTTLTDVSGLSITYTVPSNPLPMMIRFFSPNLASSAATGGCRVAILEDGTVISTATQLDDAANNGAQCHMEVRRVPTAGSHTWKVQHSTLFSGTMTLTAGTGNPGPAFLQILWC